MRRQLIWEWWNNPLGGGEEYTPESEQPKPDELEQENIFDGEEERGVKLVRPCIPTHMGLMPLSVYGNFTRNFNFWMGHTNFTIDEETFDAIEAVEGVETIDLLSRYRFRVGFGKAFKSEVVKSAIQDAVVARPPARREENPGNLALPPEIQVQINALQQLAREKFKLWAIYIVPNGKIDFASAEDDAEYLSKLELFRQSQQLAGGIIYTSHDR